jgi:hypothetical protein
LGIFNFWSKKDDTVKFSELDGWLSKKVEEKKLNQRMALAKQELHSIVEAVKKNISELEFAKLSNENIPVKERHIMEGHRKVYVQRMRKFIEDFKMPVEFSEAGHFSARFSERLDSLSKETGKNHAVLSHFFSHQLNQLVHSLKGLQTAFAKLQSDIEKAGVESIKDARVRLNQYAVDLARKKNFEVQIQSLKEDIEALQKKKLKIMSSLDELKNSSEYQELSSLFSEKKHIEESLARIEHELVSAFAQLSRPLKKHTHNTQQEKLASKYISDPLGSLEEDHSLQIQEILRRMVSDIDLLELKDKQLENMLELARKLSREYLAENKLLISELKTLNKDVASKINRSIVALNIAENESWLKSLDAKIAELERTMNRLNKDAEEINLSYLKQKAKEKALQVSPKIIILDDE